MSQRLPKVEVQSIEHYVNHAELEMAFELLGLAMMKHNASFSDEESYNQMLTLGTDLGLDQESVYDPEFRVHFCNYFARDDIKLNLP